MISVTVCNTPQTAFGVGEVRSKTQNANIGVAPSARGLEIACRFFWEVGLPAIESRFPTHIDRIAAGLVAAGSDCAGNDDEVSRDHDWGPRFQVYVTETDFAVIGSELQSVIDDLPAEFNGIRCRASTSSTNQAFAIDQFFLEKTRSGGSGFARAPESALDWLKIPEESLFDLISGQVFYDPLGEFSERRKGFAAYYPDDAWRKRLAAALLKCGELGQSVLTRAMARDDYYTAQIAWWRFAESAMKVGFLLNRRYAPDQKWVYREFCKLPELSADVVNWLWEGQCDICHRLELVELIASAYEARLAALGLVQPATDETAGSLVRCSEIVSASIADPEIARLAPRADLIQA